MKGPSEALRQRETSQDWNPARPVCSPTPLEVGWGTPRPRSTSPLPRTWRPRKKQKDVAGGQTSRQRLEPSTSLGCSSWSSVTLAGSVKSFSPGFSKDSQKISSYLCEGHAQGSFELSLLLWFRIVWSPSQ